MTGRNNRVFADSNILCFNRLKELAPGNRHELLILDGYGHQDPLMGARVADEVFPQFLPFLRLHAAARQAAFAVSPDEGLGALLAPVEVGADLGIAVVVTRRHLLVPAEHPHPRRCPAPWRKLRPPGETPVRAE